MITNYEGCGWPVMLSANCLLTDEYDIDRKEVDKYIAQIKSGKTVQPITVVRIDWGKGGYLVGMGKDRAIASYECGLPVKAKIVGESGKIDNARKKFKSIREISDLISKAEKAENSRVLEGVIEK